MIKNILKLSIATVLLLGATAVRMEASDGVPALSPDDEARTARGVGRSNNDALPLPAGMLFGDNAASALGRGMSRARVVSVDPMTLLALMMGGSADGLFGNIKPTATSIGRDCGGCPGCFSHRMAVLEENLASLTSQKTQTSAEMARLTAELGALDADADKASLTASCERLQTTLAEIQAAIDAIPGKRTALEAAHRLWEEKEAAERAAKEAREAEEKAQAAALKQLFLEQFASSPASIEFGIERLLSAREHTAAVSRLLQEQNFAGLTVTGATVSLTLAPLPASVSAADDTDTGVPSGAVAVDVRDEGGESDHEEHVAQ